MPKNGDLQKTTIQGLERGIRYEIRIILIDKDLGSYEEDGFIPTTDFLTRCNSKCHIIIEINDKLNLINFLFLQFCCP